jgi:nitrate reductase (NAD(P)H)
MIYNIHTVSLKIDTGDGTYGASHRLERIMDPARSVILAFMMNGELLHPDHGIVIM